MATISIATSANTTLTLTYTVSETDTKTTITVTKIYWKTTRSGGWAKKYYWDLDFTYSGINDYLYGAAPGGVLPKGQSTRSYTGTWRWTHDKTHSAVSARAIVNAYDDDLYDVYKYSSYISLGVKTSYAVSFANGGHGTAPSGLVKWYGEPLMLRPAMGNQAGTAQTCTVSYNGNGGTVGSTTTSNTKSTRSLTYVFVKWKASNGATFSGGATYTTNAATTMTAQWNPTYGAWSTVALTSASRQNYLFNGWYPSASGGNAISSPYRPSGNTTLYAQWTQVYASPQLTVKRAYRCDANGNRDDEGEKAAVEFEAKIWQTSTPNTCQVSVEVDNGQTPKPSKTSSVYTVSGTGGGWYTFTGTLVVDSASLTLDSDRSYPVTVTVTDTQGGSPGRSTAETAKSVTLGSAFYTIDVLADDYLYNLTEDTGIVSGKTYYVLDGGVYSPVAPEELDASDLGSYYEANGPRPGHGICFGGTAKSEGFEVDFKDIRLHNAGLSTDTFFLSKNLNVDRNVAFGIGSGGNNVGIWDYDLYKWIVYCARSTTTPYTYKTYVYDPISEAYVNMGLQSTSTASNIASAAPGFTITGASYAQWGRVATVEISLRNANAISSGNITNTTLATMVPGKLPKVAAPFTTGGTGPVVTGYINTNGNVILSATAASIAAATSGTTLTICATYVVA